MAENGNDNGRGERLREAFHLALGSMRSHRMRSGLVILGVAIGVATLMGMVSLLHGLGAKIEEDVRSSDRVVITVSRYNFFAEDPHDEAVQKRERLRPEDAEFVAQNATRVQMVHFYVEPYGPDRSVVLRHEGRRTNPVSVVGAAPEMIHVYSIPVERGRLFTPEEVRHRRHVVLLGYGPANDLFPNEDPIGQRLRIRGDDYEIIGTFKERQNLFGSLAENYAVVPYTTYLKRLEYSTDERYLQMALRPGADLQEAEEEVSQLLRIRRLVPPGEPDDFDVVSSDTVDKFVDRITQPIGLALVVISSIGLMVGGIGVMNIMLVSVTERTREIGLRKALGATRGDILTQFLIEAATLTGLGGLAGIVVGLATAGVIHAKTGFPAAVPAGYILLAVFVSAGVGIGFGLWPAQRAARQDPIEALRYE